MPSRLVAAVLAICPATALAEAPGLFAGVEVTAGTASGSSGTRDGGAPFAGGGIVGNVQFGETLGIGGHVGYQFDTALSVFASYQHVRGDIGWNADFPAIGASSRFDGSALSDVILGNVAFDLALSDATTLSFAGGTRNIVQHSAGRGGDGGGHGGVHFQRRRQYRDRTRRQVRRGNSTPDRAECRVRLGRCGRLCRRLRDGKHEKR